jgi:hypothetical protein
MKQRLIYLIAVLMVIAVVYAQVHYTTYILENLPPL